MTEKPKTASTSVDSQGITASILVINGGSSSIRFAVYQLEQAPLLKLAGKIGRIGEKECKLNITVPLDNTVVALEINESVAGQLVSWLERQPIFASIKSVGHRVVHGMNHSEAQLITPALLEELQGLVAFAPQHLPLALELIELISGRHPELPQVACFDTAFHQTMPHVASQLPLPRDYEALGLRRYGFHGLSCEYLMKELQQLGDPAAASGRVILAHLGSGASLTAVQNGKSIDNSMGFTPMGGLMMGTRSGDVDPGIVSYLLQTETLNVQQFNTMISQESGLLGVSEISADIRDLLALETHDVRAAEAINLFCYQVRKWIGAFSAALGGLDTLVFAGGIGENSSQIRERICAGLNYLGIKLSPAHNIDSSGLISTDDSAVNVRVIATDEEIVIARSVASVLRAGRSPEKSSRLAVAHRS